MTVKAGLYARVGIAEYWVLDVAARRLIVHRAPAARGYDVSAYSDAQRVAPLAAPGREFPVADACRGDSLRTR